MEIYWSLQAVLLWTCRSRASDSAEHRYKRIANASPSVNEHFPYVAKVIILGVTCSGFILNKRYVATGRQCIGDFRKTESKPQSSEIYVGYGSMKKQYDYKHEGVQKLMILTAYCYSEDNKKNQMPNDLCLLYVYPRFMWTSTVKAATLPKKSKWPVSQTKSCVLASYGKGFDDDDTGTLRSATFKVKHPLSCPSLNESRHLDRLLCSSSVNGAGSVSCTGDTGAPLTCGSNVVAILQGNENKTCGDPADDVGFIYLPPYLSFIETVIWNQPERYRVAIRSSAVSYLINSKQNVRLYIAFFIMFILGKYF